MEPISKNEGFPRYEGDMCAVHTIQSLLQTANKSKPVSIPEWLWNERRKLIDKNKELWQKGQKINQVDNEIEFEWINTNLMKIQEENNFPFSISLNKGIATGLSDITSAINEGKEVIIFGKNDDYRVPHVYHIGKPTINGFDSFQQHTNTLDLVDYFMRFNECQVAYASIIPK